ncbi:putative N-acetylated-alpha-linked acidic dipeptidase [Mizuhopecten yessoensis]|uniref:glutamate carboxypeptidase II n=1 Tax=Mizuhopecten yessoensis TaxID=6573 RepID=A0A210QTX4_MIZYE|nr:putative N-acetylated-alpha-linked acidic dipeptidase [Mizuhopecten yessoensis]OWF52174.1 Glutamate carboxypeptidase 2 [Mizuhopecten yessoensis]
MMYELADTDHILAKARYGNPRRPLLICGLVALVLGLVLGLLIGRFGLCPDNEPEPASQKNGVFLPGVSKQIIQDGDPTISDLLINSISSENIRQYLQDLSELPHLAGTDADYHQAKELHDFWKQEGLDEVYITPYDVLLSYPNVTDDDMMNRIELINATGGVVYQSPLREAILHPSENKSGVVPPFNAYSPPGDILSERLFYVNYGRVEDYCGTDTNNSLNVTGSVVIARYGKIFRGDKVKIAAQHGAIGIIIFSDPADYTLDGDTSRVYPDDWWLPPTGAQRGTTYLRTGDPLTPGYPATDTAFRIQEDSPEAQLPTIPVHPIGYGIAQKILEQMSGDVVPEDWRGKLNLTYRYGGKLKETGWKIRMFISTQNAMRRTFNAFGILRGAIEPDRYVLMGNHRDAWVFGAIDPSSGTAVMKEVSRAMGNLVKQGKWRPRRTIIFCSWGAEEYGLVGSSEWIEQYVKNLAARSLAYVNVDIAVEGNYTVEIKATPLMYRSLYDATKKVKNPNQEDLAKGMPTVYDKWLSTSPTNGSSLPKIPFLGAGSDYARFVQSVGLPCADMSYTYDKKKYHLGSYPLYHSVYETFYAMDELIDRGFKHHETLGQIVSEICRNLADSLIIPFDVIDFAKQLEQLVRVLDKDYGKLLRDNGIRFEWLEQATQNFTAEANKFHDLVDKVNKNNPFAIRQINDQLIQLERAFIDPAGLPGRPLTRHILFAQSSVNTYAGSSFPGLVDALFEIENTPPADRDRRWNVVKQHFSVIVFTIGSAQSTLREVTKFMPD